MERAFDRVNPGDEVPPPPEELREWASNTATGTLGGMIYGMIQAARTDPFVNAAGEPMSAIVAKRHRWMRGAHEATMGGLRVGSFVAVFSAIEMGAQVKRGGARDMWNTALAGTVTAAATGLAIPGGIATRLRGAALGLAVGAGIGLPLGYARYELERTVLVPEREKAATARGETTETRGKRDYTGEVIADARRSMKDADAAVAKRRRWFPWFRGPRALDAAAVVMDAAGMDPYWSAELIDAPAGWDVARGPGRRLLGGGLDLTAEENQVYLFLLMFGTLLFAVPPLVKCVHIIKAMRAHSKHGHRVEDEDEDALWDFQDQYDDLKNVHDPLDGDARDKRKKRRERR